MHFDGLTLDPAVLAVLPPIKQVLAIMQHGKTNWSTGYKLDVELEDGTEKEYFIKVLDGDRAEDMAHGEFESQTALSNHIPDNVEPPIAWGTYENDPSTSFFITRFRHLLEELPPISELLTIVKRLHQTSKSPTGKFGFHITTFFGPSAMDNEWTDSWEVYYDREFRDAVDYVQARLGEGNHDDELTEIAAQMTEKVIPRLLRPLQTGGRSITPTLCHGDLWDSNVQLDAMTNRPVTFDPCCFYGHNEMDFNAMRAPRYTLGPDFVNAYKNEVGASEPREDFDDRNALYAIRNDLKVMGMWPQWIGLFSTTKAEMRRLIEKFPDGIDGFVETGTEESVDASNADAPDGVREMKL